MDIAIIKKTLSQFGLNDDCCSLEYEIKNINLSYDDFSDVLWILGDVIDKNEQEDVFFVRVTPKIMGIFGGFAVIKMTNNSIIVNALANGIMRDASCKQIINKVKKLVNQRNKGL